MLRNADAQAGFTLLEVIIALAIMLVALTSILAVESGSLNASARSRQMNVVAMLARNAMLDAEMAVEGKTFEEVKKEDGGTFPEPYSEYTWKREIKEIEFPNITVNANADGKNKSDQSDKGSEGTGDIAAMIAKLVTKFLGKSIRELNVIISWKKGSESQSFTLTTYWVDLNHEFEATE